MTRDHAAIPCDSGDSADSAELLGRDGVTNHRGRTIRAVADEDAFAGNFCNATRRSSTIQQRKQQNVDPRRRRSAACGIDVGRVVRVVPVGTFMRGICLRRARDRILCSSNLSVAGEALAPA